MTKKSKKNLSIPDLYLPEEIRKLMAQICGKSEDTKNYPNYKTYMETFREPFVLSMALALKNLGCIDVDMVDNSNLTHTIPSEAIHSQWDLIIKVIAYWHEYQCNPENTHEILSDPTKLKKIAQAYATEGASELESLMEQPTMFITKIFDILAEYNSDMKNEVS